MCTAKILFVAAAGLCFLEVFHEIIFVRPIVVALSCLLIAFYYKELKAKLHVFHLMYDVIFGDDYKQHLMEGIEKEWDNVMKNHGKEDKDSGK